MSDTPDLRPETLLVHQPVPPGSPPPPAHGAIHQNSLFPFRDFDEMQAVFEGRAPGYFYTRSRNPNFLPVEATVARLEGAESACLFASGMAAVSAVFLAYVPPGARVVVGRHLYGGTGAFLNEAGRDLRYDVVPVDFGDLEALAAALTPDTTLAYFETPTNPHNYLVDLAAAGALCRARGVLSAVDNTFATPLNQQPLAFGIDLTIHSGTKFLAGHSDLLCGLVCGPKRLLTAIRRVRKNFGAVLNGFDAWLLARGLKTLALRVERQNANALSVAQSLSLAPRVRAVYYPLLGDDEHVALAARQMKGGGGVVSFEIDGGVDEAKAFLNRLRVFQLGASLGGVESLANLPAFASHLWITAEQRRAMGVGENLVRLAVGIEHVEDLLADLDQALAGAGGEAEA